MRQIKRSVSTIKLTPIIKLVVNARCKLIGLQRRVLAQRG